MSSAQNANEGCHWRQVWDFATARWWWWQDSCSQTAKVLIWRINWKGKEILKSVPIFDQICLTGRPIVQLLRLWRLVRVGWLTPCNRWSERSVAILAHAIAALARNLVSIMLVYRWKRNAFGVKILCVFRNIYRQDRWAKSETVPVGCAVSWWCWRQGSKCSSQDKVPMWRKL